MSGYGWLSSSNTLSLKIVQDNGAVTRKVKLDPNMTVQQATKIVSDKANLPPDAKDYALFIRSLDDEHAGIWMEDDRTLSYYVIRDGDRIDFISKIRNLRLRMLDGHVKTLQVDQSKQVSELMQAICPKLGITNHEEYGLCFDLEEEMSKPKSGKEQKGGIVGTLTRRNVETKEKDRDLELEQLSKKLQTDDNVNWVDMHKSLSEAGIPPEQTLLLKRRLFYSDRNIDSRDPVQLTLLYEQTRDNILKAKHPVVEEKAADCKVRWINIRDVHRRILRKCISGTGNRPKRPYKYDKQLEFMKAFYKEVIAAEMEEDSHDDDKEDNSERGESSAVWNDVVIEYENCSSDERDSKPLKKRKRSKPANKVSNFEEVEIPSSNIDSIQELDSADPVDAFLISIGATLKRFSPYHLNLAKSKIFHIVQEHDLQQIVERQPGRADNNVNISTESPVYFQG